MPARFASTRALTVSRRVPIQHRILRRTAQPLAVSRLVLTLILAVTRNGRHNLSPTSLGFFPPSYRIRNLSQTFGYADAGLSRELPWLLYFEVKSKLSASHAQILYGKIFLLSLVGNIFSPVESREGFVCSASFSRIFCMLVAMAVLYICSFEGTD